MKNDPSKFVLGLALLFLGAILILVPVRKVTIPETLSSSFESEPINIEGLRSGVDAEDSIPRRIIIPDLSIDVAVKSSKIINGYWEVYPDTAAWGEGSGLPGSSGNQIIFAHAREGLFLPLQSIKVGDRVYVLSQKDWFTYEVKEIKEVFPNQVEVIAPTPDETLTLYTCSGYKDQKRLVVISKRIET